eukprot:869265-Rhodomonas_salina.1
MPSTDVAYGAAHVLCYGRYWASVSAYAAATRCPDAYIAVEPSESVMLHTLYCVALSAYALATPCPVLRADTLVPGLCRGDHRHAGSRLRCPGTPPPICAWYPPICKMVLCSYLRRCAAVVGGCTAISALSVSVSASIHGDSASINGASASINSSNAVLFMATCWRASHQRLPFPPCSSRTRWTSTSLSTPPTR